MGNRWKYKSYEVEEGLKPGSRHFQYFYVVSEEGRKKSNYCIWIEDEALARFAATEDFETIASLHREAWGEWVKDKIDMEDFRGKVLKFEKDGEKEIELSEMAAHLSMD